MGTPGRESGCREGFSDPRTLELGLKNSYEKEEFTIMQEQWRQRRRKKFQSNLGCRIIRTESSGGGQRGGDKNLEKV